MERVSRLPADCTSEDDRHELPHHRPIRIALIDDHEIVLWGLKKLIESEGLHLSLVGSATTADEGARLVGTQKPDIVLLDLTLGSYSGLDLIACARQYGAKVIVFTGNSSRDMIEAAVMAGASGVLHKAQAANAVLQAIERVYHGELWLDRATVGKVFTLLQTPTFGQDKAMSALGALTPAERAVIAAVVKRKGAPNKVIADTLHISPHTLRNHLASVYEKLGIHRRVDLVFYALENGLAQDARKRA